MSNFGTDFSGVNDLDANWTYLTNDVKVLSQAVARRLTTPNGGDPWDASYGLDLRTFIADTASITDAQNAIESEAEKDERVDSCTCTITATANGQVWTVVVNCVANTSETFTLTLTVDAVTVSLLDNP